MFENCVGALGSVLRPATSGWRVMNRRAPRDLRTSLVDRTARPGRPRTSWKRRCWRNGNVIQLGVDASCAPACWPADSRTSRVPAQLLPSSGVTAESTQLMPPGTSHGTVLSAQHPTSSGRWTSKATFRCWWDDAIPSPCWMITLGSVWGWKRALMSRRAPCGTDSLPSFGGTDCPSRSWPTTDRPGAAPRSLWSSPCGCGSSASAPSPDPG
jgi:hypothetical protein